MIEMEKRMNEPQPVSEETRNLLTKMKAKAESPAGIARDETLRMEQIQREAQQQAEVRRRLVDAIAGQVGARFSPARCSLESYRLYDKRQHAIFDSIKALASTLPAFVVEGRGIIWYGSLGTGKDHLAISLLYLLAREGVPGVWIRGLDLYGRLRDRIDQPGANEETLLRDLATPAVLCISDPIPSVGDLTPWRTEFLLRLVDRRYNAMKSTWVTLNSISVEDADAKLSAQVFDRLRDGAAIFKCFWPTNRERSK